MNVIDAGANIGAYSMMMSHLVTETGKVIAFEPDKRNISLFKKSTKANSFKNIILYEQLLSDSNGENEIYLDKSYFGSTSIIRDELPTKLYKKNTVSSITLDEVILKENMIDNMQTGSIIYDLAAIQGGNSALTKVDEIVEKKGVRIMGDSNILNKLPISASTLYAKNVFNFVSNLLDKESNKININLEDEIIKKTLVK